MDAVFAGSAIGGTSALNPARWVALAAGLPLSTSASYVEMQCGSAIDSINHAAWRILANHADIMIAGGMESMTQAPHLLPKSREGYKYGDVTLVDAMAFDALTCAFDQVAMGAGTEKYAASAGIRSLEGRGRAAGSARGGGGAAVEIRPACAVLRAPGALRCG